MIYEVCSIKNANYIVIFYLLENFRDQLLIGNVTVRLQYKKSAEKKTKSSTGD